MDLKTYFDSIDLKEIYRYTEEGQEEHITLDFKLANFPYDNGFDKAQDADKKNYSKALSGYANSGGGIIIWGIKTRKLNGRDIATERKPIKNLTSFLNRLNQLEGSAVVPTIKGVVNRKIIEENDLGYVITFIPESDSAPHMAQFADKYYYKRNGDSFLICEHFDIIDIMSRRKAPNLGFLIQYMGSVPNQGRDFNKFLISVKNDGNIIAKFPFLAIKVTPGISQYNYGIDDNGSTGLRKVKTNTDYDFNYSGGSEIVIYPHTKLDVDILTVDLASSNPKNIKYQLLAENMEVKIGELSRSDLDNIIDYSKSQD